MLFGLQLVGKGVIVQPHVISVAAVVLLKVSWHRRVGEGPLRRKVELPTGSLLLSRIFRDCCIAYLEIKKFRY